jgi:hypothetical protein
MGNLSVEAKSRTIVQVRCVLAEVFGQKLTAQGAHDTRVPERGVHLRMAGERIRMKIAGTDCCPDVVDQHYLGVHVDVAASSAPVRRSNSDEREIVISVERFDAIKECLVGRALTSGTDIFLGLGGNEENNFHATLQSFLKPDRDLRNRKSLIFDVDRPARCVDRSLVLLENAALP